jgi:hypothetical protein
MHHGQTDGDDRRVGIDSHRDQDIGRGAGGITLRSILEYQTDVVSESLLKKQGFDN